MKKAKYLDTNIIALNHKAVRTKKVKSLDALYTKIFLHLLGLLYVWQTADEWGDKS